MPSWWNQVLRVKYYLGLLLWLVVVDSAPPSTVPFNPELFIKNVFIASIQPTQPTETQPTCSNMTLTPFLNDTLCVEIVSGCYLEINGREVTTIQPEYLEELVEKGVVSYRKNGHQLLFLLDSLFLMTVNVTCNISCADISLPLTPPNTPAHSHLVYSRSVMGGVDVTIADVVCDQGYHSMGNETRAVFRPVGGLWYWTLAHSNISCVEDDPTPTDDSDDSTGPNTVAIAAVVSFCALILMATFVGILITVKKIIIRRRSSMNLSGNNTSGGSSCSERIPQPRSVLESGDKSTILALGNGLANHERLLPQTVCSRALFLAPTDQAQNSGDHGPVPQTSNAGSDAAPATELNMSVEEEGKQPEVIVYTGVNVSGGVAVLPGTDKGLNESTVSLSPLLDQS